MTVWAFDIETQDWDTFVLGAAVSDAGDVETFHRAHECAEWYLSLPTSDEVISHYGGGFDFLFLISITPDETWTGSAAGASLITCRARGHALCRDSTRLFPMSLAKWTGRKTSTGLPCECGNDCGGYCAIKVNMSPPARKLCMSYCVNDCQILIDQWSEDTQRLAADGFHAFNPGGKVRNTLGGIAWESAAIMGGIDPKAPIAWGDYDAGRLAYYGGRCEVGATSAPAGHRYDVHAMYPWALTQPVPVGRRVHCGPSEAAAALDAGLHGSYSATVIVPDTDLPLLPHRYNAPTHGRLTSGRLVWATGVIVGHWTAIELQWAIGKGAVIQTLDSAHVWLDSAPLFEPYVRHAYARRNYARQHGDDRWASVLKWYANSLSGKLAQQPEVSTITVLPEGADLMEGYVQHGPPGSRVWSKPTRRVSPCAMTWAAACLTSRSRVLLGERLSRHPGTWLYCDTDSTYLTHADADDVHPSELGKWGYDGPMTEWTALAPKLYRYRSDDNAGHVKARGVSRATWDTFDALVAGESVDVSSGVAGIRSSGGAFIKTHRARSWLDRTTGRVGTRFATPSGRTRPLQRTAGGVYR